MASTTKRTRVCLYIRVSTSMQVADGYSLDVQESRLRAYCQAMDHDVVGVEIDAGASAKSLTGRPALARAIAMLRSGKADAIAVTKIDRLSRSLADLCSLVDKYFRSERWSLISLGESLDTRSATGRAMLQLLGVFSQLEREQVSERTSAAMAHLREQGAYCGGQTPYGMRLVDGELVEDADELALVREARELRDAGMSQRAIVAMLGERGRTGREGRPVTLGVVQRLLARAA